APPQGGHECAGSPSFRAHVTRKFAILLDGGFVTKRLATSLRRIASSQDVANECARISSHPELAGLTLLRIYYYDSPPATGMVVNPLDGSTTNLGRTQIHDAQTTLHNDLELMPNVALRRGDLAIRGWRVRRGSLREIGRTRRALAPRDLMPDIEQKGVDLRL